MSSFILWSDLTLPPLPAVYLLSVSLPLLILSEVNTFHTGLAVFKIISSIAFVSGPFMLSEWSPYQRLITYGLVLSLIGDICLIPSRSEFQRSSSTEPRRGSENSDSPKRDEISNSFKLGVAAFAGAHIAYIIAFLENADTIDRQPLIGTFLATLVLARFLGVIFPGKGPSPWNNILNLTITGEMRPLVTIYALIIGSMLAVSAATISPSASTGFPRQRLLGAIMFVLSDLFVAKDAFGNWDVRKGGNKLTSGRHSYLKVGLGFGLYFWAQMVLAGTVYE
ncbi:hypothetical protein FQN54_003782 [Arachnomyces sp. PD_36]|nr:hypothetical protein FQN54_003782 [Arachnomyces sp. PD_36]